MAPHQARGSLNIMFQLAVTLGILAAQVRVCSCVCSCVQLCVQLCVQCVTARGAP